MQSAITLTRKSDNEALEALKDPKCLDHLTKGVSVINPLTAIQKIVLEYHEKGIETGLKKFLTMGKHLFAIRYHELFVEAGTWSKYCKKWGLTPTGAADLMASYRTWQVLKKPYLMALASYSKTKALPLVPSQTSIDTVRAQVNKIVDSGLTKKEFKQVSDAVAAVVVDIAMESTGGKLTAPAVAKTVSAIADYAETKAVEIDGEQINTNGAASILITKDIVEQLKREKQYIVDDLIKRKERLNKPLSRDYEPEKGIKTASPVVLCFHCCDDGEPIGKKAPVETSVYALFSGGLQLECGCVYTMPVDPNSHELAYDTKRTKEHLIESEAE